MPDERKAEIIRSDRRTLSLSVKPDGSLLVRAPKRMPEREIQAFITEKQAWITRTREKLKRAAEELGTEPPLTEEEIKALKNRGRRVFAERAAFFAPLVGVSYGRISVRMQRSKWGSCTAKGDLSFNALLLLAPPEVLDAIVVHELCHRIEMNHSEAFYRELLRVYPRYPACKAWLKRYGPQLLSRLPQ